MIRNQWLYPGARHPNSHLIEADMLVALECFELSGQSTLNLNPAAMKRNVGLACMDTFINFQF